MEILILRSKPNYKSRLPESLEKKKEEKPNAADFILTCFACITFVPIGLVTVTSLEYLQKFSLTRIFCLLFSHIYPDFENIQLQKNKQKTFLSHVQFESNLAIVY